MGKKMIVNKETNGVIAVDVGGTQIRAAFFLDDEIEPLELKRNDTKAPGENPLDRLINLIKSVWPEEGAVTCIAIGVPGPLDPRTGIVNRAPNIDSWKDLPLVEIIQSEFKTPCRIGNDANLAALAEWKYGAGIGHSDLLYFTISTGIGGGIISAGELLVGSFGLAGEVGHIKVMQNGPLCGCGKTGHLEAIASGTGIANYLSEQLASGRDSILGKNPSAHDAAEAAKKGDALSLEAFERAGSFLGQGIASMLHLFNPSIIVLGGGVTKAGDLLLKPFRQSLESEVISPAYLQNLKIEIAKLGDQVVLIGALVLART